MIFFLGPHETSWLGRTDCPLFVSRRRLARRRRPSRALGYWALDSGGFSELNLHGCWKTSPAQYAEEVERYQYEIGNLEFAAVQDWMCEPFVLSKTGKTLREHQERTIQSYLDLKALAPDAPWMPVLQGYVIDDYLAHVEQYDSAGIDLTRFDRVGVGSVCRRQNTREIQELFEALRPLGLPLHGFGLKTQFLKAMAFKAGLTSFDSLSWSLDARRRGRPLDGCTHKNCANCLKYALLWRENLCSIGQRPQQMLLEMGVPQWSTTAS